MTKSEMDGAAPAAPEPIAHAPHKHKKHKAKIEHKIPGRIRMKIPAAKTDPSVLDAYQQAFSIIPGVTKVTAKRETGSIVVHYDVGREKDFEHHFGQIAEPHHQRVGSEIDELVDQLEGEAEFLAGHSQIARATVDFVKQVDRELRIATGNTIDIKIVLAAGLAAFTFFEIGAHAATPMWVTLALFTLNHFAELHSGQVTSSPRPVPIFA